MAPLSEPGQGRARALLAGNLLFLVVPYIFVGFRLWSRREKRLGFALNDYLIILALFFNTAFTIELSISTILGGYGQHVTRLSMEELEVNAKTIIVSTVLWPTTNTCVKLSVLHFYKKIFTGRRTAIAIYIVATLTFLYWLGTFITAFSICQPFEYNWNKVTVIGHCGDVIGYYLSTGIVNLLLDVMIVALPLPVLWGLQMKTSKKISLSVIFSLGAGICVISIVRCISIATLDITDPTYNIVLDSTTTALEPCLGIINACLPLMQPVASKLSGGSMMSWLRTLRVTKSTTKRLGSSESRRHTTNPQGPNSNRTPNDVYPLTNVTLTQGSHEDTFGTLEVGPAKTSSSSFT